MYTDMVLKDSNSVLSIEMSQYQDVLIRVVPLYVLCTYNVYAR